MAVELKTRGASYAQIAEHLQCDDSTARTLVSRGLAEYFDDHHEIVHRYLGINLARYDQMMRTWFPKALGGTMKVRNADGTERVVPVEPDAEAARICIDIMREVNKLLGNGQSVRMEITAGANGAVLTAAVDAMEAARAVRAAFGEGAAKMLPVSTASPDVVVVDAVPVT
jgi:hypothetical protein